eukprot:m.374947 g.374947  ORF g.374947 m.374947 type:complete len:78 (-) comp20910_c0_seq10:1957-2190(-)
MTGKNNGYFKETFFSANDFLIVEVLKVITHDVVPQYASASHANEKVSTGQTNAILNDQFSSVCMLICALEETFLNVN